jgi:hypothetical protein
MNTVSITISNKRLIKKTDKAYVFTSRGYGGGEVFTIPLSVTVESKEAKIENDDATTYTIEWWFFSKIKDILDGMHSHHIIMPN